MRDEYCSTFKLTGLRQIFRIFGYLGVYIAINLIVYQGCCGSVVLIYTCFFEVIGSIPVNDKL